MAYSILCTGSSGLVASSFKAEAKLNQIPFYGLDLHGEDEKTDIFNLNNLSDNINKYFQQITSIGNQPILFHFAAMTNTSQQLSKEEIDLAWNLNVTGTKNVIEVCRTLDLPLVHISTDYVFAGGNKTMPYLPLDPLAPDQTIYSQTKANAETEIKKVISKQMVIIVRFAFPYGNMGHPKRCILRKFLNWMSTREKVKLYDDQAISPTPISYIALGCFKLADLIYHHKLDSGTILHLAGQPTTPYDFGLLIKEIFEQKTELVRIQLAEEKTKNLVLDTSITEEILGISAPSHREALIACKQIPH